MEPETKIKADMRLLIVGNPEQLNSLRDVSYSTFREFLEQNIIIAGYGEVGESAYKKISSTSSETTLIDIRQKEKVDVIGDILDPDILIKAGIEDASAILITVEDDTAAVFATLIARDLNPDIRIVVRVNEKENIQKLYRAGADYVQSLATVSGRMLASTVVEEDVLVYDKQINIVRMPPSKLKRKTLAEADVRAKTGCTVVAIHRGENIITEFDPNTFRFEEKDKIVLVGTDDNIKQFERLFTDLN